MKALYQPATILALLAMACLIWSLFPGGTTHSVDIHLHDTYFIISGGHVLLIMAFQLWVTAWLYFITRRFRQWPFLQYAHIICILFFNIYPFCVTPSVYRNWADYNDPYNHTSYTPILLVFLLGNFAFIFNFIAGFVRGKKTPVMAQ